MLHKNNIESSQTKKRVYLKNKQTINKENNRGTYGVTVIDELMFFSSYD